MDWIIVEDELDFADTLATLLRSKGESVSTYHTVTAALDACETAKPNKMIVDLNIGQASGLDVVSAYKHTHPTVKIVVLTGYASISTAVEAMRKGAWSYLAKPASFDQILHAFSNTPVSAHPQTLDQREWDTIHTVLAEAKFNISEAARRLGIPRRTLQRKLQKKIF